MWLKLHTTRPALGQLVLVYSPYWKRIPKCYVWDGRLQDFDWSNEQHVWMPVNDLPEPIQELFPNANQQ